MSTLTDPTNETQNHAMTHYKYINYLHHRSNRENPVADLRGARDARPRSKFFHFHAVCVKHFTYPLPPSPKSSRHRCLGNPESATEMIYARRQPGYPGLNIRTHGRLIQLPIPCYLKRIQIIYEINTLVIHDQFICPPQCRQDADN